MNRLLLVAALPFVVSGCASTLPEVVASSNHPDTVVDVAPIAYQNAVGAYSHRMPVDPKPWRGLNDAQAPGGGA
ncbi:UNVERIFIED_ORG: hypothetical protein LHK14_27390 (plasmid) [Roseateles sp. XES5]|jgi:hypothetical protein|uniref:Uncharacterized protein n=1 Tax=Shinella sumterensis TaxID=1967501 RepID=A0AA50HBL9_9HYPH|nr:MULTISPECIES: hypothetical protein [Pseudomonadota]WLS01237.1 hypothetical protein Q9313_28025 [Shinella sumterensis]WLS11961.1 hypothetical protein Q9314_27735 [Shinella sumterensis]